MARSNALLRLSAVLLVVVVIVRPGDGLRCYKCTSDSDPSCETNPKETENCEDLPDFSKITGGLLELKPACLKAVVKDNGRQIVMRNCIVDTSVMKTCDLAGKMNLPSNAEVTFCESCQSDLCNNSNQIAVSFLSLLLPCIIALILSPVH
uniref:Ly6/neurotoxin 8 n=1 Tax=Locusta migratoria manilensis TaxID=229990 RepID=A0A1Y0F462_LOCMI|nr:ly6/neurotoxin 8 [Locusta migratoria manilensis]